MSEINFADKELARRLEAIDTTSNALYTQAKAELLPESGSTVLQIGDGTALYAGDKSPINRIHGLGMQQSVSMADIAAAESFYRRRAAHTTIDLCPLADPSLLKLLHARRYTILTFKQVWWRYLVDLHELPAASERIRIEEVEPHNAKLWAQVVSQSFAGGGNLHEVDTGIAWPNAHKAETICTLAWIGTRPVGGGAVTMHAGTAVCFSTSVHPSFRRLGVQTALLRARLRIAAEQGADLVMVQTTPGSGSQRNAERFGFRLAYTKPTMIRA